MTLGLYLWSRIANEPVLLAGLDPSTRTVLYGSIAGSAGALLGLTIASISILLTLDDERPRVKDMQSLPAWRILHITFLTAAGMFALALASSSIALAVDSGRPGIEWLEIAVVVVAATALVELVVAGLAFTIVVLNLTQQQ
jgi:hypothetical protein